MKIYTRTGDSGDTALFGGGRVPKDHIRVEAYGTVDELNAVLGHALSLLDDEQIRSRLELLQHDLFAVGSELATPTPESGGKRPRTPGLPDGRTAEMEAWVDEADAELAPLRAFVLPGGTPAAAVLHVARTVCRRAERAVVTLRGTAPVDDGVIPYLNRLSDLLFTWARLANHRAGRGDVEWRKSAGQETEA